MTPQTGTELVLMINLYQRLEGRWRSLHSLLVCQYFKLIRGHDVFKFQNRSYCYFIHEYNHTWKNERIIEIPIIKKIVDQNINSDILEVGNVLSHYFDFSHDVIDKYEMGKNVINADVVNFKFKKKYDLIISISTLEHIGWDEKKQDTKKVLRAIDNLKTYLKKKGKIVFTHPLGYNPFLDAYIKKNRINCNEKFLLKRISASNQWQEVAWEQIFADIKYNDPFPFADGVVVGIIQ